MITHFSLMTVISVRVRVKTRVSNIIFQYHIPSGNSRSWPYTDSFSLSAIYDDIFNDNEVFSCCFLHKWELETIIILDWLSFKR